MTDEQRELINQLFAEATALLEDVLEIAVAGQSPALRDHELDRHVARLQACSHDIATLSQAALVIANSNVHHATPEAQQ